MTPHGIPTKQETPWERLRAGLGLIAIPQQHPGCVRMECELTGAEQLNAQLLNREKNAHFSGKSTALSLPTSRAP